VRVIGSDSKAKSRQAEWWEAWWQADYSWAGLANKFIGQNGDTVYGATNGAKTLQDYWRRDPEAVGSVFDDAQLRERGRLVKVDGIEFHVAHLPVEGKTGAPTWKAEPSNGSWQQLAELLHHYVVLAADSGFEASGAVAAPDGRAQFEGTVLRGAPHMPDAHGTPIRLNLKRAAVLGVWNMNNYPMAGSTSFYRAMFLDAASFDGVNFQANADFGSAIFCGPASFVGSHISGTDVFRNAIFGGHVSFVRVNATADFLDVTFDCDADFSAATLGKSSFERVKFIGAAVFLSSRFFGDITFGSAEFRGYADFRKTQFSAVPEFRNAHFASDVDFEDAAFSQSVSFDDAVFGGVVRFERAGFEGVSWFQSVEFASSTYFVGAEFKQRAAFNGSVWRRIAAFSRCRFGGPVELEAVMFHGETAFDGALFSDLVHLEGTSFLGEIRFHTAVFNQPAYFHDITWPAHAEHWHGMFRQTLFERQVSFTGSGFRAFAAFDGATLKGGIRMDEVRETGAKATFFSERENAIASVGRNFPSAGTRTASVDDRLRELERGSRVLKQVMIQAADGSRAQLLHQFELRARRRQSDVSPGERFFSALYAWTSDYGGSFVRPLVWLVGLVTVFAIVFFGVGFFRGHIGNQTGQIPISDAGLQAMDLAMLNVYRPLALYTMPVTAAPSDPKAADTLFNYLLRSDGTGVGTLIRNLASLESIFAIILVFLFGLALRRRFQVS
jgi:uncharacterized protein YjbI with pentapeptide repeats